MLNRDRQEPLEAGDDGTFDLGDPSPPPSPTKPVAIPAPAPAQDAADDSKAPLAENEISGSPPIADDWEKVDLRGVTGNDSLPAAEEQLDEFKDAIEMTQEAETSGGGSGAKEPEPASEETPRRATGVEPSGSQPSPSAEKPATAIAAGLANVRLPMGFHRQEGRLGGDSADSDGEEEFHDAHDSGPGIFKDAAKAREMKELGNGWVVQLCCVHVCSRLACAVNTQALVPYPTAVWS